MAATATLISCSLRRAGDGESARTASPAAARRCRRSPRGPRHCASSQQAINQRCTLKMEQSIWSAGLQATSARLHKFRTVRVKSGEAEGSSSITESVTPDEEALRQDLEMAIEEEDYARAAKLRDELRLLQEDSRSAVLAANARFYDAFKNGDLVAMHSAWVKGDHVYVVHPSAGRISGYETVMQSWEMVCDADHEFPLQIDLDDVEVHVRGDLGYVTCLELVKTRGSSSWGKQMATNVFEKVDGKWLMCIHHASHFDE